LGKSPREHRARDVTHAQNEFAPPPKLGRALFHFERLHGDKAAQPSLRY
jgi:hypothetical protein